MAAKVGGAQLDNFQLGLNGHDDLLCRAARWTNLARWTFGAADQAQPQAAGRESGHDMRGETGALPGSIEYVKTTTVENKIEWAVGRWAGKKVEGCKVAPQIATVPFGLGPFNRE
jgi:hypothetical protein